MSAVDVLIFVMCWVIGYRFFQPLGWWLFRAAHRNNPEALAFADRRWVGKR